MEKKKIGLNPKWSKIGVCWKMQDVNKWAEYGIAVDKV